MRILSIDGGGIRGIIPGQVLVALEHEIQDITGDPNRRIADCFDLIAGTSTGGILACLYLCPSAQQPDRPRFSADEAVNLYLQNGDDIFDVSVFKRIESLGGLADEKYSADELERVLKLYFGDLKLGHLMKPCLVPAYDITRREAKFFNQADVAAEGSGRDFYVRDVARATSAAPTYFEPANIQAMDKKVYPLIDGGVFTNNPAMCACVEAFTMNPKLKLPDLKVLSLGTGKVDRPYHYSEARDWGKLGWVVPVLDIMMSGVSETVDYQLQTLFESAGCGTQYLRLQLDLAKSKNVDGQMDNASEENMRALEDAGKALAQNYDQLLSVFAKSIISP